MANPLLDRLRSLRWRKDTGNSNAQTQVPMKHTIHVTPVPKDSPDLERFVAALLAFVLARRAAEAKEREQAKKDRHD